MDNKELLDNIAIIEQMINKTKEQLSDNSPYFLLWGIAIFLCAVVQYILLKLLLPHTQYIWFSLIIVGIVHIILAIKDKKKQPYISYTTNTIAILWSALGISFFILSFLSFQLAFNFLPIFVLLYGIGTYASGKILEFKPLIYGGFCCFIICIVMAYIPNAEQLLLLALSILISFIIPAFLLKSAHLETK